MFNALSLADVQSKGDSFVRMSGFSLIHSRSDSFIGYKNADERFRH